MNTVRTLALGFLIAGLQFSPELSHGENFFVALDGNDLNPGSEASPFASLERARAAARQTPEATVILQPGTYRLTNTFALDGRDSGTTYRGQNARITGSVDIPVGAVKPVTDPATLERLLPAVRGKVLEIDLRALGITNFGEIGPRGFRRPYIPAPLELFVDDQPLKLARWPNPGQPGVPISRVFDKGSVPRNGEKPTRGGTFALETDRPARWAQADDVWITGFFFFGYADDTVKVKSFDLEKKSLTTLQPHMYGFTNGQPWNTWVALNLLEEIDEPGEFVADKPSGKLFFLPPVGKDIKKSHLEVSVVQDPLIAVEGATNVVFDGINIECSRGMGVYIERGKGNQIKNATLRNLGLVAVCIGRGIAADPDDRHSFTGTPVSRSIGSWHEHLYENPLYDRLAGTEHGVVNCNIYNIGAGAISMGGGDRANLTPGGNSVENCEIHDFNLWDRTYKAAVNIDGVGNSIRHCLIYNCPGSAIYLHGNDHLIEFNEVHHAMMEGDDHGAFYMGRDPTERGNIIRYNYWHDIAPTNNTYCLYFDDSGGDGSLVYGNIFRQAGYFATININNGSDIVMTNNVFIDCRKPIRMGVGGGMWRTKDGRFERLLKTVNYDKPPWCNIYPELLGYLAARPQMPRGNLFADNLLIKSKPPKADGVKFENNRAVDADPAMKYSSIPGFAPIPFDRIGIQKNGFDSSKVGLGELRNPVWSSKDNLRDPSVIKSADGYFIFYSRFSAETKEWNNPTNWHIAQVFTKDFKAFANDHDVSPSGCASPGDVVFWHGRWILPYQTYPAKPTQLVFSESTNLNDWTPPKSFLSEALNLPWNELHRVIDPSFAVDGDTLHCWFIGSAYSTNAAGQRIRGNLMGHAITQDPNLQRWEILTKEKPLLGFSENAPDGVENTMVFRTGDHWTMIYSEGLENQHLACATSTNLTDWKLDGAINIPRQSWMVKKFGAPFVWREGDGWLMILMGTDKNDRTSFGLLHSLDGHHWKIFPEK